MCVGDDTPDIGVEDVSLADVLVVVLVLPVEVVFVSPLPSSTPCDEIWDSRGTNLLLGSGGLDSDIRTELDDVGTMDPPVRFEKEFGVAVGRSSSLE